MSREQKKRKKGTSQVKFKEAASLASVSSVSFPNKGQHLLCTHIPTEVSVLVSFPAPHPAPPLPPPPAPLSLFWIK